jgi:hypothetical protein
LDATCEIARIVERIDPKKLMVGERKAGVLKAHKGDGIDEGEIAGKPLTGLLQSRGGNRVQHNSNLNPL